MTPDSRVTPPGVPLDSGFDYEAVDQEAEREVTRRIQREIAPFVEDVQRARRVAMAEAHMTVVGGSRA